MGSSDSVEWAEFKSWNAHDKMELFDEIRANSVAGVGDEDDLADEFMNDNQVIEDDKVIEDRRKDDRVIEDRTETIQKATSQTTTSKSPEGATTRRRALKSALKPTDQYKVTGDTVAKPVVIEDFAAETEEDGEEEADPEKVLNHFLFNTAINSDPGTPKIREALDGPQRQWWTPAVIAEINNFLKRGAWRFVDKSMVMQEGRKIIPCIWVLKVKDEIDGTKRFKARLVSCGYVQIPGVDYTEKFSPVATDTSLKILIGIDCSMRMMTGSVSRMMSRQLS